MQLNHLHEGALFNKGRLLLLSKRYLDCLPLFNRLLDINEIDVEVWHLKGLAFEGLNQLEEALKSYEKILMLNATHKPALNQKAICLSKLNRFEEALSIWTQLEKLTSSQDPNFLGLLFNMGSAFLSFNKFDEAIQYFDKVLELNPNFEPALLKKGTAFEMLHQYSKAIDCYKLATKVSSNDNSHLWHLLGGCYFKLQQEKEILSSNFSAQIQNEQKCLLNESLLCQTKILELEPSNREALFNAANIHAKLSHLETREAIQYYNQLSKLFPNDIQILTSQWKLLSQAGDFNEALECFKLILTLDAQKGKELLKNETRLLELFKYHRLFHELNIPFQESSPSNLETLQIKKE